MLNNTVDNEEMKHTSGSGSSLPLTATTMFIMDEFILTDRFLLEEEDIEVVKAYFNYYVISFVIINKSSYTMYIYI